MKAEILALLRAHGDYVSGQELCGHFGVSRTAVWKAIGQLKKEGYAIEAVQNRGYRLLEEKDELYGQNELASRIRSRWAGVPLHYYDSLDSTNLQAKVEAEKGAVHGTVIVTDEQTAGRGRRGNNWKSPAGKNLYFTLLCRPSFAPDRASMLTLVMALAVKRAIETRLGRNHKAAIKWPNDIVADGKKVCGILTEMSLEGDYIQYVVIGAGINVREQDFPQELADKAASLEQSGGKDISRAQLLADIMAEFEQLYEQFTETEDLSAMRGEYESSLVNRNREVCVIDPKGEYNGIATGITDTGELLVVRGDGTAVKVYAGEVSVRGLYGYI